MEVIDYIVDKDLEPFINCVMLREVTDPSAHLNIPLYADGYPGIMFQQASNGFYLQPRGKKLSELFLYGQTLDPVSLEAKGAFRFVVVQLYPFASKYLLGIDPKVLNDDCYDLLQVRDINAQGILEQLKATQSVPEQIALISDLMRQLIKAQKADPDDRIQLAIDRIIKERGQVTIKSLLQDLPLSERSFERNFQAQVGLSPKQFARIVQFQRSLHQLNESSYNRLVEIGLDSGFADQSHFIRTFKKYTGQTPSYYLKAIQAR